MVRDSRGAERLAPLFFVAPQQVNYLVPAGTAAGLAAVTIRAANGARFSGVINIRGVAPGLFAANANGQGVAAAVVLRVRADGSQRYEALATFDPTQNRFVAQPIDLGPSGDQVFLLLFGTGWRGRSSLAAVQAQVGSMGAEVLYAGAQGELVGLDQLNVRLPRSLVGGGEVELALTADGKTANIVKVSVR